MTYGDHMPIAPHGTIIRGRGRYGRVSSLFLLLVLGVDYFLAGGGLFAVVGRGCSGARRGLTAAVVHRQKRIIPILVGRGARTEGALKRARNGLAGAYEDFFDRKGYQEIVELLQALGIEE